MNIKTKEIVSSTEMIKSYKDCRKKAEDLGKIFVFKNNQPDAVMFSINEYERLSMPIEYMESLDVKDYEKVITTLPKESSKKSYPIWGTKIESA